MHYSRALPLTSPSPGSQTAGSTEILVPICTFSASILRRQATEKYRHAAVVIQRMLACRDKILLTLALYRFNIGQKAASQNRDEHLDRVWSLAMRIDPQLGAGIVHEYLVSGLMFHAHRRVTNRAVVLDRKAELGQAIAVGMFADIFIPLLECGHSLFTQVFTNSRKKCVQLFPTRVRQARIIRNAEQLVKFSIALGMELLITHIQRVPFINILLDSVARATRHGRDRLQTGMVFIQADNRS